MQLGVPPLSTLRIIDIEHPTHPSPMECPIDILPNEIISEIQVIATHLHLEYKARYRFPSVLSQVSRLWRAVAQGSPKVWSFIYIFDAWSLGNTGSRLARTGGAPMEILIDDPLGLLKPSSVMKPLITEYNRWRSFELSCGDIEHYVPYLPKWLRNCDHLLLETSAAQAELDLFLCRIRYLTLINTLLVRDCSALFRNLTELHMAYLDVPFEKLKNYLQNSPNLEVLVLYHLQLLTPVSTRIEDSLPSIIKLPELNYLVMVGLVYWEILMVLQSLHAPVLQRIDLEAVSTLGAPVPDTPFIPRTHPFSTYLPCLRRLVLSHTCLLKEEAEYLFLRMPEIKELVMVDDGDPNAAIIFNTIFMNPTLAGMISRLSAIYLKGIPGDDLLRCFSSQDFPETSRLLKNRIPLIVRKTTRSMLRRVPWAELVRVRGGFDLSELARLIPHLEITEDDSHWDIYLGMMGD